MVNMQLPRPYSLQSRFIVGLIVILLVISAINLTALFFFMKDTMESEVASRAAIVLQQADAVKKYVQHQLRPKMFETAPNAFILEAMSSSFITRNVMERTGAGEKDFVFRRVAIGSRNKDFEATPVEAEIIEYFRQNPAQTSWQGLKEVNGEEAFVFARPVVFTADCLLCHGDPADAPPDIIKIYGERGFGHVADTIGGIDSVLIPTSRYALRNESEFVFFTMIYLVVSFMVLFFIYLTFQRVVVVNLRTLTSHFRKNFSDQKGVELLKKVEHGDEIAEMIEGMEGLSQHLLETELRLKRYNADLEQEVEQRTQQISLENERHKEDLNLFIDILRAIRRCQSRPELWRLTLPILVRRFHLARATFFCTFASHQSYSWPTEGPQVNLPADFQRLITHPQVAVTGEDALVPVGSSEDNTEGLLFLHRQPGVLFASEEEEVLRGVGRLLGVVAENIVALDSMLRQGRNLQTIFDGISDPLLLVEGLGTIVMANRASELLLESLPTCTKEMGLIRCLLELDIKNNPAEQSGSRDLLLDNGRSFIMTSIPLPKEKATAARQVIVIHEDTDRRKMLGQVVHGEKMATVGKLAAGLAHELNNPLGVILCYSELIRKSMVDEQQQADIDVVIKHTVQAQQVLRDLLNFARPKVSTQRATQIGEVAEAVVGVFKVQAGKKNVTLGFQRSDQGSMVLVEPQVVEHIVLNLLLNALDAMPPEGGEIQVNVSCSLQQQEVTLTVADNGSGIAPEHRPHVFDPFFTTKEINEGTGLGLSMIYGYMNELGGSIEAQANTPQGTVFVLNFPLANSQGSETHE